MNAYGGPKVQNFTDSQHKTVIASWVQVVSHQKLNSNRENIVLYSIKLDVFSIAIEFLTTNDSVSELPCRFGNLRLQNLANL